MMYFSKLKTALIVGVCVLGVLFCLPNFMAAPARWMPWRQVHLGLDLRGGSYLLLEVDMAAVTKERLNSLGETVRDTLRGPRDKPTGIQFQPPQVQAAQNRVTVHIQNPAQVADATKLLQDAAFAAGGPAEYDVTANGQDVTLTLTEAGLRDRANSAVTQSIEIVRRRIDETGVLDPQITRQGDSCIVVQLPGVEDPNRIKELIGKTAKMTFCLVDENA